MTMESIPGDRPKAESPVSDALREELMRYDRLLTQFAAIADPILLSSVPEAEMRAQPEEAPMHQLHTQVLTLRAYNDRFSDLNSRLRP